MTYCGKIFKYKFNGLISEAQVLLFVSNDHPYYLQNGLYSALPSLTVMVISLSSASLADYMVQRGIKIITVRKIMWSTGRPHWQIQGAPGTPAPPLCLNFLFSHIFWRKSAKILD